MSREPLFPDTDEQTERVLLELVRAMPAWRKLEQVADLTNTVRQLAMIRLREEYPNAHENELRFRLAIHMLGNNIAALVYGSASIDETSW